MSSKWSKCIQVACCGLILGCGSAVSAQANRNAAPQPATQPAVISVDAFAPGDTSVTPEVAAKFKAKLVTLNVTNMPAVAAMAELAKASGYQIKPGYDNIFQNGNRRPGNVTINAVDQPFWAVFRDICVRGNVGMFNNGGDEDHAIKIAPGNYGGPSGMRGPVSIKGPFFAIASYLERENTVNMSTPANVNRSIHVQMQFAFEPGAAVSEMSYEPVVDEAIDDNGNSMVPPPRPGHFFQNMQRPRGLMMYEGINLPYPTTNPGHHIVKIKGHIAAKVQTSSETIEIADPLNAAETTKTIGGKTFTVSKVTNANGRYQVQIITTRGDEDQQSFANSQTQPQLHLTDAQGKEASHYNMGWSSDGEKRTTTFGFNQGPGAPVKLVVEVPTGIQEIGVPFELDNLPLP